MFRYLSSMFGDPRTALMFFLLAFPGRLLAISAHEFGHALVADRCGDNTARMLGRLTLNPLKHLDLWGTIMMLVFGFGWAKPVPVNPRNYRNYRKDDLLVSIAGVTMNFLLFLLGFLGCSAIVFGALHHVGARSTEAAEWVRYAASINSESLAAISGSRMLGYVYQMLSYFTIANIGLAIFNLLPIPPLDGYHVLNDLVLRRSLFASPRASRNATMILFLLLCTGALGTVLSYLVNGALSGVGWLFARLFTLFP